MPDDANFTIARRAQEVQEAILSELDGDVRIAHFVHTSLSSAKVADL